jgi:hypothetical protein
MHENGKRATTDGGRGNHTGDKKYGMDFDRTGIYT